MLHNQALRGIPRGKECFEHPRQRDPELCGVSILIHPGSGTFIKNSGLFARKGRNRPLMLFWYRSHPSRVTSCQNPFRNLVSGLRVDTSNEWCSVRVIGQKNWSHSRIKAPTWGIRKGIVLARMCGWNAEATGATCQPTYVGRIQLMHVHAYACTRNFTNGCLLCTLS